MAVVQSRSMKWIIVFFLGLFIGLSSTYLWLTAQNAKLLVPLVFPSGRPLDAYTIPELSKRMYTPSTIVFDDAIATTSAYTSYNFHFLSDTKKVAGLAHIPRTTQVAAKFPVIIQLRGFVARETYTTGVGTARSGQVFAQNGFLTIAPDFLGYGRSDPQSSDVFEERFETYTVAANLIASIPTLTIADPNRIALWGHSNGGQIALTVLEILGKPIPTSLWAPVSKPFPYSILYYTDEASDSGKLLRKFLASFEKDYDTDLYSMSRYIDRIVAPMQIHQGTADDAVPVAWTNDFVKRLQKSGKDATIFIYPGANHNMVAPGTDSWSTAVMRDVEFFKKYLEK